jgi:diguanylate cyclase (GGDEF)-like protein
MSSTASTMPHATDGREKRRAGQRVLMLQTTWASYLLDAALLGLLGSCGAMPFEAAWTIAAGGSAICFFFHLCFSRGWNARFLDPYLAVPQLLAASALELWVAARVPQASVLTLTVLFIAFAFAALRLSAKQLFGSWLLISVGVGCVVLRSPTALSLPHGNIAQTLLSVLWLCLVLGRCALVGLYGAGVRQQLGQRNRELAEVSDKLEELAMRDPLTGALNRRAGMRILHEALADAASGRSTGTLAVALADIDFFKLVNDRHGHPIGDEVLQHFVLVAARTLRAQDRLARYGGEEFLVVLPSLPSESVAGVISERLREHVEAADWNALVPGLSVSVSVGLACLREGESAEELVKRADAALYEAKKAGRNRVALAKAA